MTANELIRRRRRRDALRAACACAVGLAGAAVSLDVAYRVRGPVHWATWILAIFWILLVSLLPLLIDVFDHSFVDAVIRDDLGADAQSLAARLYGAARLPSITIWSSPGAGFDGHNAIWLKDELHIALNKDVNAMPEAARRFALAHAIDSIISARGIGWRRVRASLHQLPVGAAILLSAVFGGWVILGLCLWVMAPIIALLVRHRVKGSTPGSYPWLDKRLLSVDKRAAWATDGMTGARAWYTVRMAGTDGFVRETLRHRLAELEKSSP
ncbi:MAG: hypothetical protein ACYC96_07665 [Fimbriimonadaceae bacterium]